MARETAEGVLKTALGASLVIGGAASALFAAAGPARAGDAPVAVSPVTVNGARAKAENRSTGLATLPGTVQDTPQTINVIPPELLQQQGVTTLEQALRNVAGITMSIGEGGTLNGDQFKVRGQDAKDDVYLDGLRDFGVYVRDSFNDQEVQVLKGPSATAFGRGTTGAAINIVSKAPTIGDSASLDLSVGTGQFERATADLDHEIAPGVAVRLNLMAHSNGVVDRDLVKSQRWGIAPSIGFGLDGDTRLVLSYLHQEDRNIPDYGVPLAVVGGAPAGAGLAVVGGSGVPVTELGVDRSTFYGFSADHDRTKTDMVTARFSRRQGEHLTLTNDARLAGYSRDFLATKATCSSPTVSGTATTAHCIDYLLAGNPAAVVGINGPAPYRQNSWGVQDIATARLDGAVARLRSQTIVGLDLSYQSNDRRTKTLVPAKTTTKSLTDPDASSPFADVDATAANSAATTVARKVSTGADAAAFVSERLWLAPHWSVIGAVRYDRYQAEYDATTVAAVQTTLKSNSNLWNPKAALVFEPNPAATFYVSYAQAATPQGTSVTDANASIASLSAADLAPERNTVVEAGGKIGLMHDRLGLDLSVFQVVKNNAKQTDPVTGDIAAQSGERQRINGFEASVNGQITRRWSVNLNYSYLDATILQSYVSVTVGGVAQVRSNIYAVGRQVTYVPRNAAALWTTYDLSGLVRGLSIAGGVTYQSRIYLNYAYVVSSTGARLGTNTYAAPESVDFSGAVTYRTGRYRIAVNGYNLGDRLNYAQVYADRVVPEQGRTVVVTVGASF
jgi:catecholate siderophore receptor